MKEADVSKRYDHKVRRRAIRRYRADVKRRVQHARRAFGRLAMAQRAFEEAMRPPRAFGVVMLP